MLKELGPGLRLTVIFTVLTGLLYPAAMTGISEMIFPRRANGSRRQRVVASDHHRLDSHGAQLIKTLPHSALDNVFQIDHAKGAAVFTDYQRCSARTRYLFDSGLYFTWEPIAI